MKKFFIKNILLSIIAFLKLYHCNLVISCNKLTGLSISNTADTVVSGMPYLLVWSNSDSTESSLHKSFYSVTISVSFASSVVSTFIVSSGRFTNHPTNCVPAITGTITYSTVINSGTTYCQDIAKMDMRDTIKLGQLDAVRVQTCTTGNEVKVTNSFSSKIPVTIAGIDVIDALPIKVPESSLGLPVVINSPINMLSSPYKAAFTNISGAYNVVFSNGDIQFCRFDVPTGQTCTDTLVHPTANVMHICTIETTNMPKIPINLLNDSFGSADFYIHGGKIYTNTDIFDGCLFNTKITPGSQTTAISWLDYQIDLFGITVAIIKFQTLSNEKFIK